MYILWWCNLCTNMENIEILNNLFTRSDGSGIFQKGYNRDIKISKNKFVWIGDNAIGSVGDIPDYYNPYVNKNQSWNTDNYIHELAYMQHNHLHYYTIQYITDNHLRINKNFISLSYYQDIMDYLIYVRCCITGGDPINISSRMTNTIINTNNGGFSYGMMRTWSNQMTNKQLSSHAYSVFLQTGQFFGKVDIFLARWTFFGKVYIIFLQSDHFGFCRMYLNLWLIFLSVFVLFLLLQQTFVKNKLQMRYMNNDKFILHLYCYYK